MQVVFFMCFMQVLVRLLRLMCSSCARFIMCELLPKEEKLALNLWTGVLEACLTFVSKKKMKTILGYMERKARNS